MTIMYRTTHVPGIPDREAIVARQRAECPGLVVIEDPDRAGLWPTTEAAYADAITHGDPGDHVLILQDDMMPCDRFHAHVEAVTAVRPDDAICLFSMRAVVSAAVEAGAPWVETNDAAWGGSTVIPYRWAVDFLDWTSWAVERTYRWDDRRLLAWLHWNARTPVWLTAPSLLQHVGAASSLVGNSNRTRTSATWTQDGPPLTHWALTAALDARTSPGGWLNDVKAHLTPQGRRWLAGRTTS